MFHLAQKTKTPAHAHHPDQSPAPAEGQHAEEQLVNISELVKKAQQDGITPALEDELKKLSARGLDRFVAALEANPRCKPVVDLARRIKEYGSSSHEYKAARSFDHSGALHLEHGKLKADDAGHAGNEFTYDRAGHEAGHLTTGKQAADAEQAHQAQAPATEADSSKDRTLAHKDVSVHHDALKRHGSFGKAGGTGGSGHIEVLGADANASGDAKFNPKSGITVSGNAGASVTLVSGGAEFHTKPVHFSVAGEQFTSQFKFSVDGNALAEAKGHVVINANTHAQGVEAGISGFAGAKIEGNGSGTLDWDKKPAAAYAGELAHAAPHILSHFVPPMLVRELPADKLATLMGYLMPRLMGDTSGDTLILGASAHGSANAGIGAEAAFSAGMSGGVIHCHGKFGVTFALGASGDAEVTLGAQEGMRMLGVMSFKGADFVAGQLRPGKSVAQWLRECAGDARKALHHYCQDFVNDVEHAFTVRKLMGHLGVHL